MRYSTLTLTGVAVLSAVAVSAALAGDDPEGAGSGHAAGSARSAPTLRSHGLAIRAKPTDVVYEPGPNAPRLPLENGALLRVALPQRAQRVKVNLGVIRGDSADFGFATHVLRLRPR